MSYVSPNELVVKMIDAGTAKIRMSTSDTLIREDQGEGDHGSGRK